MRNADLIRLFRAQHGLASRQQICDLEPERNKRRSIYRSADVDWATPVVLRHMVAPATVEQGLMVKVLDAGDEAALWGKSAASHWGFGRFRRLPAHVAVPRRTLHRSAAAGQVHVLRHLRREDCVSYLDVPTARPEVVILWLAGMWTHRFGHEIAQIRTAIALDQAWRQNLVDGRYLHALAENSGGRGRSGIVVLRSVLEDRPPDYRPAGSRLEERFEEIVPARIRRSLSRQVTVDVEPVVRTVDYRLTLWPLIIEINGEAWHSSLVDRAADEVRYERLRELGFSVVVFWEYDVWHDAATIADAMRVLADSPDSIPTLHRPTPPPWRI